MTGSVEGSIVGLMLVGFSVVGLSVIGGLLGTFVTQVIDATGLGVGLLLGISVDVIVFSSVSSTCNAILILILISLFAQSNSLSTIGASSVCELIGLSVTVGALVVGSSDFKFVGLSVTGSFVGLDVAGIALGDPLLGVNVCSMGLKLGSLLI